MNEAIELHDAKLTAIDWQGARCVIRFQPAYVHRSHGVPGQDSGKGGWRDFQWEIDEATTTGEVALPAWVMEGRWECGDAIHENVVSLPLVSRDRIVLSLSTNKGEDWVIQGTGIRITPLNEGRYCEIFP